MSLLAHLKAVVAGATVAAFLIVPSVSNMASASAAPADPPKTIVKMSLGERLAHIGAGIGLGAGSVVAATVGLAPLYGAIAAVGISAVAAPVVVGVVIVGLAGFGVYELTKGLIGRKEVAAGANVSRNASTNAVAPSATLPAGSSSTGVGIHH